MMYKFPKIFWLILGVLTFILIPFFLFGAELDALFQRFMTQVEAHPWRAGWALFLSLGFDVVLPVPSSLASTLCGVFFGVWGGFLLSFGAMTLSCLLGWTIGRTCTSWAMRLLGEREAALLEVFFVRYGVFVLIALRAIPVLAEASALFAGLTRMPIRRSFLYLAIGNAAVSLLYALVGAWGKSVDAMLPAFLFSCLLSGAFFFLPKIVCRRTHDVVQ